MDEPKEPTSWTFEEAEPEPKAADDYLRTGDSEDVIAFRRSHLYAMLLPLAFVVGLGLGYVLWGRGQPVAASSVGASQASAAGQAAAPTGPVTRYDVPVDDDFILGPVDAPITIIEFSDYECPYCQKFHIEVFGQLLAAYPNQIRFVYRDFPLTSIHPNAFTAALAANCAGEQGAYFEYHDALFSGLYGLGADAYQRYASDLGLDMGSFGSCVETAKYQAEVQADFDYAAQLGIRSTPTFFVNGIPVVGAQPLEVFRQLIDAELAGELE